MSLFGFKPSGDQTVRVSRFGTVPRMAYWRSMTIFVRHQCGDFGIRRRQLPDMYFFLCVHSANVPGRGVVFSAGITGTGIATMRLRQGNKMRNSGREPAT